MLTIPVRKVTSLLIWTAAVLVVVSAAAIYARDVLGFTRIAGVGYLQVFRIDREVSNLPVWYSSSLLLVAALSIAAIGGRFRGGPASMAQAASLGSRWWALALMVLAMSIDESARIHERVGAIVRNLTGFGVSWIVPAAVVVLAVLWGTRQIWRTVTRADRLRFTQAAAVFAAGAIGMEVAHKVISPEIGGLVHYALVHVEEALEMCGAALLIRAAWTVLAPDGLLTVTFGTVADPARRESTPTDGAPQEPLAAGRGPARS